MTSILRVLAYNPEQVVDGTYSTVGTVTWSSVEQGLGIVCACLPTFGPLFATCLRNRRSTGKSKADSSMGMTTFRSTAGERLGPEREASLWKDDESTVGFARLHDDEGVLPPMNPSRNTIPRVGVAISSDSAAKEKSGLDVRQMGITKEQTIDQRSEIVE